MDKRPTTVVKLKTRSKAGKLRAKRGRGRPRLEGIYRQPNGQPSRAKNPPQKVALEARARLFGLTMKQAKDPRSATNLGRLAILHDACQDQGITDRQYNAVQQYLDVVNDYKKSLCSPGAQWGQPAIVASNDEDDYTAWCERAKSRYEAVEKAIAEAQRENPDANFHIVLTHVIGRDIAMPRYIGDLRLLCNVLHRHFNPQQTEENRKRIYSWVPLAGM